MDPFKDYLTNEEVISQNVFEDFFKFVKMGKPKPVKNLIIPIDTVSKACFDPTYETGKRKIQEFKSPKIFSYLSIESSLGFPNPLDEIIYRAVVSEIKSNREFITPSMLYRDIGGSAVNNVSAAWKERILNSVKKLVRTWIVYKIPLTVFQKLNYDIPDKFKERGDFVCFEGHLLDCQFISLKQGENSIDGAFKILFTPPLLAVAETKGQIITTNISILNIPNLKVTETTLVLKNYIIEYVLSVIGSRTHKKFITIGSGKNKRRINRVTQLNEVILFQTLFDECNLQNFEDKKQRQDIRAYVTKIMNHLQAQQIISEWHFRKDGTSIDAISFSL